MTGIKKQCFILVFVCAIAGVVNAQHEVEKGLEAITESAVKGQLEFLASDWTEGRAVGTKGAYLAADYIASIFKIYGIKPFGDIEQKIPSRVHRIAGLITQQDTTYFQNFSLLEYAPGEIQSLSVITHSPGRESAVDFNFKTDFSVNPGSVGRSGKAPLVFAGYGLKNKEANYDDLIQVDVNGKIAVILAGFPGHRDPSSEAYKKLAYLHRYSQYYLEREKIENLSEAGAVAIIVINTEDDPTFSWAQNSIYPVKGDFYEADEPFAGYYDTRMVLPGDTLASGIPVFHVSSRAAGEIFSGTGISISAFELYVAENLKPSSHALPGKMISFKTTVDSKIIKARNVLGMIEGQNKDEYIVVGGHYDHIGKWNGWIWNGADDNASGTVGVMTMAKAFMATGKKPEKTMIFAAWTGEEKGLWGSSYFVRDAMKDEMNIILNLNFDMIARDAENDTHKNKASMVYTRANAGIAEITKKHIEQYNINLDLNYRPSDKPSGGSDHAPFARQGIPVFYFMAAMHSDYHQPSDEPDQINWEKIVNIIKIGFLNTWSFANSDEYRLSEQKTQ